MRHYEEFKEMADRIVNGDTVWVKFIKQKESRCGSIGRIVTPIISNKVRNRYHGSGNPIWYELEHFEIEFPGTGKSSIKIPVSWHNCENTIEWIRLYSGSAVRVNTPREKLEVIPEAFDRFGTPVAIGEFVTYVRTGEMGFGVIRRMTPAGSIFIDELDSGQRFMLADHSRIVVIQKDFRERMMLRKLSK
jgi:hypothetical protein